MVRTRGTGFRYIVALLDVMWLLLVQYVGTAELWNGLIFNFSQSLVEEFLNDRSDFGRVSRFSAFAALVAARNERIVGWMLDHRSLMFLLRKVERFGRVRMFFDRLPSRLRRQQGYLAGKKRHPSEHKQAHCCADSTKDT